MAPSTLDLCRFSALTALTAASTASAFQSTPPASSSSHTSTSASRHNVRLMAAHYYPNPPFPFPDPYNNPYNNPPPPYYQDNNQYYYRDPYQQQRGHNNPYNQQRPTSYSPRYSVALDAEVISSDADERYDAEVIDDADELLTELQEEEEWISDRERAQMATAAQQGSNQKRQTNGQQGEVINFDPENPASKPLRSAASYTSDMYEDENKFQGRRPGQPVNIRDRQPQPPQQPPGGRRSEQDMIDEREQHVILDDYDDYMNDFFQPSIPPPGAPNQPRRPGPSVYTQEEEDLIAAMGGRGHRTTQEFAGLGTMKKNARPNSMPHNEMPLDPQQQNYNPEQFNPPPPPPVQAGPQFQPPPLFQQPPQQNFREEGYLGDSTLKEISLDYAIPIPYLADVVASWGAPVPIDPMGRLGDMVTGEQAFAILEAIHTLDIAGLHERYSEDTLMNICDYYEIDLKDAFEFCVGTRGWALPFGVRTFLRVEQEEELLDVLGGEVY